MNRKSSGTAGAKLKDGERRYGHRAKDNISMSVKGTKGKSKKVHCYEDVVMSPIFEKLSFYIRTSSVDNVEPLKNLTARLLGYLKNLEVPKKINDGWPFLVTILKNSRDPETIRNVIQIINNQMSSRQGYRAVCNVLINLDVVTALLESLYVAKNAVDGEALMLEIHGLVANIATKDPDFAFKAKKVGSMTITVTLMKNYMERLIQLRPILLLLKLATTDNSFSSYYGKLGVLPSLLTLVNSLGRSQSTTLKLVLEILAQLTKSKFNGREVIAHSGVRLLFNQLEIWEKTDGLNKLKILRAVLICLNNLTELKSGRNSVYDVEGLRLLYRFCHGLPSLSEYDTILSLATIVAHRCLPPKWLPIENVYGAVTYQLPGNVSLNTNMQNDMNAFNDDGDEDAFSSSSDNGETSATMNPNVCQPAKEFTSSEAEFYKSFLPEKELASNFTDKSFCNIRATEMPAAVSSQNHLVSSFSRGSSIFSSCDSQEELPCVNNTKKGRVFSETIDSKSSSKRGSFESDEKANLKACADDGSLVFQLSNLLYCDEKIRIDNFLKDFKFADVHRRNVSATIHVAPFVKIAFPELTADKYYSNLEPLYQKNFSLCRQMLLQNLDSLYGGVTSKKVVYDYDALISTMDNLDRELTNDDQQRLGKAEDLSGILHFESRFECGNLRRAIMLGSHEYELILNPDINSGYHHQWFYFEVSNMEAGVPYSFYITNCEKNNSQFNFGMKPLLYSVREATLGRAHWIRAGRDVCYYRNYYSCPPGAKGSTYFTTHFTISFQHPRDVCYIAYHYPYSYSLLHTHLHEWENSYDRNLIFYRKQTLCKTIGGNEVPIITVTSNSSKNLENRCVIFLTGRVHPGETNASWVMKGTIDFLLSDRPSAESIRENFILKIVPMLNPDGVINGCHRCSLSGLDLNRCWLDPDKDLQPTIFYTKRFIHYLNSIGLLPRVYCDYHGHSRRKNVFLYGCNSKLSWLPEDRLKDDNYSEILPKLLYQLAPAFSLNSCCFTVEQNRESTARVTLWRELNLKFSYTMESSYCGCDQGPYKDCHLGLMQLREMGMKLCQAILHLQAKMKGFTSKEMKLTGVKTYRNGEPDKMSSDEELDLLDFP